VRKCQNKRTSFGSGDRQGGGTGPDRKREKFNESRGEKNISILRKKGKLKKGRKGKARWEQTCHFDAGLSRSGRGISHEKERSGLCGGKQEAIDGKVQGKGGGSCTFRKESLKERLAAFSGGEVPINRHTKGGRNLFLFREN